MRRCSPAEGSARPRRRKHCHRSRRFRRRRPIPVGLRARARPDREPALLAVDHRPRFSSSPLSPPACGSSRGARPARPSVAVLPFANLSDSRADDAFSEGVAEEVLGRLAQIRGLRVVARSISFQYAGRAVDLREVGRRLGATAVVEGSVRRAGDRLRVSAQLVSVADGFQLWSQTYERRATDVFEIQDDVARSVANALRVELKVGVEPRAQAPTSSLGAFELYAQGRYHLNHDALAGLELAADSFQRATESDPRYAAAQAALAETYALLAYYRLRPQQEAWSGARQAAERALALDPSLAEAHAVLGLARALEEKKWDEAEPFFRRALELGPESSDVRVAYVWGVAAAAWPPGGGPCPRRSGRRARPGLLARPQAALVRHPHPGRLGRRRGELPPRRATRPGGRRRAVGPRDGPRLRGKEGGGDAAVPDRRQHPQRRVLGAGRDGVGSARRAGEGARGDRSIGRACSRSGPSSSPTPIGLLGDADAAALWLERAYAERDPQLMWSKVDPRLARVRADPRIQAVIRGVGL